MDEIINYQLALVSSQAKHCIIALVMRMPVALTEQRQRTSLSHRFIAINSLSTLGSIIVCTIALNTSNVFVVPPTASLTKPSDSLQSCHAWQNSRQIRPMKTTRIDSLRKTTIWRASYCMLYVEVQLEIITMWLPSRCVSTVRFSPSQPLRMLSQRWDQAHTWRPNHDQSW